MTQHLIIDDFLRYQKAADKSGLTIKTCRSDLYIFAHWFEQTHAEALKIHKITPVDLRQYKQHMEQVANKPQTINRHLNSLKYFLEWGFENKKISYHLLVPKPVKQMRAPPKWLSRLAQNALLRHMERYAKPRDTAVIKIFLTTGLRVQEVCDLMWQDIVITSRKGHMIVKHRKGNKYREIPLNKDARLAFINLGYQQYAGREQYIPRPTMKHANLIYRQNFQKKSGVLSVNPRNF